jgi:hypothetical protein
MTTVGSGNGGSFRGEARMYLFLVQGPRELVSALGYSKFFEKRFLYSFLVA